MAVNGPDARQAAYDELLKAAAKRGDAGASTSMTEDILNGVDMGRAGRMADLWNARNTAGQSAADAELSAYATALTAERNKKKSGGGVRRSGGGGGMAMPATTTTDPFQAYINWLIQQQQQPTMPQSPARVYRAGAGGGMPILYR